MTPAHIKSEKDHMWLNAVYAVHTNALHSARDMQNTKDTLLT